jgi:thioredoxin-related protein
VSSQETFFCRNLKNDMKKTHSVRSTTTRHFDEFFGVMKESNVPHRFSVKILAYDDDDYYDSE